MTTGGRPGLSVANPATGKFIYSDGVLVVENADMLPETVPGADKGAQGIVSHVIAGYQDTTGATTQLKLDVWAPGDAGTRGEFKKHGHGNPGQAMGEWFIVLDGAATFEYHAVGKPPTVRTISGLGAIYFPPNVMHAGWNQGLVTARLLIMGVREAGLPGDAGKGENIPPVLA